MELVHFRYDTPSEAAGAIFGGESEDLDFTLVQWNDGGGVAEHLNGEVDVLMIVLGGEGTAIVGGEQFTMSPGDVLLIPKDTARSIQSSSKGFRYLNVHKRKRRLMPGDIATRPR